MSKIKDIGLKERLKKFAYAHYISIFILLLIFMSITYFIYVIEKKFLKDSIESYIKEEVESIARLIIYDLSFDERVKKILYYEEQLKLLEGYKTPQKFYSLKLKNFIKKYLTLPESVLLNWLNESNVSLTLNELRELKKEIILNEFKNECEFLKDDLIARITFSDHLKGIHIKSRIGFTELKAEEESLSFKEIELIDVTFPLFVGSKYFGDVKLFIDSGKLKYVNIELKKLIIKIFIANTILLIFLFTLSSIVWVKLSKKIEREIVEPITLLSNEMEEWERDSKIEKEDLPKDEIKRVSKAFKELINRFEKQREQLIKAEKISLLQRVSAGLSHELNNALNPLRLRIESILIENRDAKKEDIIALKEHLESATKILKDLSNINTFRKEKKFEVLKPHMWLDVVKRLFEPQVKSNIKVIWDYEKESPMVYASKEMMIEIALNLLLNAKDAVMKKEEGRIICSLKEENGRIVFCVEDNGEGFSEDYLKNRFEPFYSTKPQGMGLGLFIVENYVNLLKGEINLTKSHLNGAKVEIILNKVEKENE